MTELRRRRRHAAQRSRIAAAGLGAVTLFAIVTALGLGHPADGAEDDPSPTEPHIAGGASMSPGVTARSTSAPGDPPGPIVLAPNPVVRNVEVTPRTPSATAPVATTKGSG